MSHRKSLAELKQTPGFLVLRLGLSFQCCFPKIEADWQSQGGVLLVEEEHGIRKGTMSISVGYLAIPRFNSSRDPGMPGG